MKTQRGVSLGSEGRNSGRGNPMEMRCREGFKRVPEEVSKERKEEEEGCNGCLRHASYGVCVAVVVCIKRYFFYVNFYSVFKY